ncbi:MAG TPA: hypothetical protein VNI36_07075 [Candidatus Dormibacteraeota bacterium]|nr:hypothetical protein [Candidatus Dormibacteraeota bacterium]
MTIAEILSVPSLLAEAARGEQQKAKPIQKKRRSFFVIVVVVDRILVDLTTTPYQIQSFRATAGETFI